MTAVHQDRTTSTSHELLEGPADGRNTTTTVQRHEVINWLGEVALYGSPGERDRVADAILASGSDDEATWLAIMERVTGP